jgi:hypothetical protein
MKKKGYMPEKIFGFKLGKRMEGIPNKNLFRLKFILGLEFFHLLSLLLF